MKKYLVKVKNSTISRVNPYGDAITVFEKEVDTLKEAQAIYSLYENMIGVTAKKIPEIKSCGWETASYKSEATIEEYDTEDEEDERFEIKSIKIAIGCVCVGGLVEHEDGLYIKTKVEKYDYYAWSENKSKAQR